MMKTLDGMEETFLNLYQNKKQINELWEMLKHMIYISFTASLLYFNGSVGSIVNVCETEAG